MLDPSYNYIQAISLQTGSLMPSPAAGLLSPPALPGDLFEPNMLFGAGRYIYAGDALMRGRRVRTSV